MKSLHGCEPPPPLLFSEGLGERVEAGKLPFPPEVSHVEGEQRRRTERERETDGIRMPRLARSITIHPSWLLCLLVQSRARVKPCLCPTVTLTALPLDVDYQSSHPGPPFSHAGSGLLSDVGHPLGCL